MKIKLHIERLVLDGLPVERRDGSIVQAAVESELTRLLSSEGLAPSLLSGGAVPHAPGGSIQLTGQSNPTQMGTQIAKAVYGGLDK
jgi:hypothetical protein